MMAGFLYALLSFNPIKVLFLRKITVDGSSFTSTFQSYQGSIFTYLHQEQPLLSTLLIQATRSFYLLQSWVVVVQDMHIV